MENTEHNKTLLEWDAPEFMPHYRGRTWYLVAGVIVLSLIAYAIYSDSASMAIVVILMTGVFYMTHNQNPKKMHIRITELGIKVDNKLYAYNHISAFWIVYDPDYVRALYLKMGTGTKNTVRLELSNQNPVEVRRLLAREVPEVEGGQESFTDILIRALRLQ